jgi:hypothetical protein
MDFKMKKLLLGTIMLVPSALSLAQLTSTGPFAGTMSEGFENFASATHYPTMSIMGGGATMNSTTSAAQHMYVYALNGWGLGNNGAAGVHGGNQGLGLEDVVATDGTQDADILFGGAGVSSFGGYFAQNDPAGTALLQFFDSANVQIGTDQALTNTTSNVLTWQGYNSTTAISRVHFVSRDAYIAMDDLQANSAVPEPASFAVLGLGALALIRRRRFTK